MAMAPDGRRLFVSADRAVTPIDTRTNRADPPLPSSAAVTTLAVSADSRIRHLVHSPLPPHGPPPPGWA